MRILLAATFVMLGAPVWAQSAEPVYDEAQITTCLAENQTGGEICVGRASTSCMATPGGETTVGMSECLGDELKQWDTLLNETYAGLTAEPSERTDALKAAQRAWITFVDAACSYEAAGAEGGSISGTVTTSCRMKHTARRAIDLRGYTQEGNL